MPNPSESSTPAPPAVASAVKGISPGVQQEPAPRPPLFGEPAPWFQAHTDINPAFNFDTLGGRWVVLLFFGSLNFTATQEAHAACLAARGLFDDTHAAFFGVSVDPDDRTVRGLQPQLPGVRYFHDHDRAVSLRYGVAEGTGLYRPLAFLLDPMLRVVMAQGPDGIGVLLARLAAELKAPPVEAFAPVLTVPRIFEPEFCVELIAHYERVGGEPSGFMRQVGRKTVGVQDASFKRRADVNLNDHPLAAQARARLQLRLVPLIERAYGWRATRLERYLVACYDAADHGFFRAHRDNTTLGTAHRRLAVTLNLNADDYDGGELCFPEFGPRTYKPPTGGATVFGCGLLHEARPVTRGRRFAFLPFLYDEAGAAIRERNLASLEPAA